MGRLGRVNQVRETSPGGDFVLHSVMLESVSWSTRTISPAVSPGLLARVTERLPLEAVPARLVGWVNLNHCVPMVMRLEFVPTGILSLVWVGPAPRRTTPLVICRKWVILKSPDESCTTCPTGQASSAAWMPLVASPEPLPYVEALTLAHTVVRAGIPPWIPGSHVVSRSAGMSVNGPGAGEGDGRSAADDSDGEHARHKMRTTTEPNWRAGPRHRRIAPSVSRDR